MRHLIILMVHLITTLLRVVRPGGVRAVVAESVLAKRQLLILNRSGAKSPHLGPANRRILFALDQAEPALSCGNRLQAIDLAEFSSGAGAA